MTRFSRSCIAFSSSNQGIPQSFRVLAVGELMINIFIERLCKCCKSLLLQFIRLLVIFKHVGITF
ncbi:hypothetical protein HanRHA438_Chr11g0492161 [Helianthus annuus]|nr:hypothetical protein HanRHA438_Chr11g0492161 [Helianthus annuus]